MREKISCACCWCVRLTLQLCFSINHHIRTGNKKLFVFIERNEKIKGIFCGLQNVFFFQAIIVASIVKQEKKVWAYDFLQSTLIDHSDLFFSLTIHTRKSAKRITEFFYRIYNRCTKHTRFYRIKFHTTTTINKRNHPWLFLFFAQQLNYVILMYASAVSVVCGVTCL